MKSRTVVEKTFEIREVSPEVAARRERKKARVKKPASPRAKRKEKS